MYRVWPTKVQVGWPVVCKKCRFILLSYKRKSAGLRVSAGLFYFRIKGNPPVYGLVFIRFFSFKIKISLIVKNLFLLL